MTLAAMPDRRRPRPAPPAPDAAERMRHVECLVGLAYGIPARHYAEKYGVSIQTIYNWRDRAKGYFADVMR